MGLKEYYYIYKIVNLQKSVLELESSNLPAMLLFPMEKHIYLLEFQP